MGAACLCLKHTNQFPIIKIDEFEQQTWKQNIAALPLSILSQNDILEDAELNRGEETQTTCSTESRLAEKLYSELFFASVWTDANGKQG